MAGMSAPVFEHGAQTDDTGSGFFSGANKVSNLMFAVAGSGGNDITAVINNDVGSVI